jgi:hypothetical protein
MILRTTMIAGFSILAAFSVLCYREFYARLPHWTRQVTESEITMGVVVAVALDAIFPLGTWTFSQPRLGTDDVPMTAPAFDAFFMDRAKDWKLTADAVARIGSVGDQAIEQVGADARGLLHVRIGCDSFDGAVALSDTGTLPGLPDTKVALEPVAEPTLVGGLTGFLSGLHADEVRQRAKDDACEIELRFRL